MKILLLTIIMVIGAYSASAIDIPFCSDSDQGASEWVPGTAVSNQGPLEDNCEGDILMESTCKDDLTTLVNIDCSDFGAVCVTAEGADYCACAQGTIFNGTGCEPEPTAPVCGDNIIESPETCDDGNTADNDGCSANCAIEVQPCGNSIIDSGELCDDGNTESFDGCSARCEIEETQVPEFGGIATGLIFAGAGSAILFLRKRK